MVLKTREFKQRGCLRKRNSPTHATNTIKHLSWSGPGHSHNQDWQRSSTELTLESGILKFNTQTTKTLMSKKNKGWEGNTTADNAFVGAGKCWTLNHQKALPCTHQKECAGEKAEQVQRSYGRKEGGSRMWSSLTHKREADFKALRRSLLFPRADPGYWGWVSEEWVMKTTTESFRILPVARWAFPGPPYPSGQSVQCPALWITLRSTWRRISHTAKSRAEHQWWMCNK